MEVSMKHNMMILFVILSLFFTACSSAGNQATAPTAIPPVTADNRVIAEGHVEPVHYAEIAFTTSGVISEMMVKEGDSIKMGQPLIRLGNGSDINYAAAQLELVSAQQALNDLQNSAGTTLAQAVIDLKDAQEAYDKAVNYLKDLKINPKVPQTTYSVKLIETRNGWAYDYKSDNFKGPAPKDWIVEAENDLALKKARLDEAQRACERMKNGADIDQLTLLEARLDAAKAGVAAFTVSAPFDGVVAKLNAKEGGSINAGQNAVTVADFSSWLIKTTDLTEMDVVKLTEGQPVTVTLDAIPDLPLKGKLLSIGRSYSENQGDIVYEVTILLLDTNPALRWGMTASVAFDNED
jgi:HlyD family secretion protein